MHNHLLVCRRMAKFNTRTIGGVRFEASPTGIRGMLTVGRVQWIPHFAGYDFMAKVRLTKVKSDWARGVELSFTHPDLLSKRYNLSELEERRTIEEEVVIAHPSDPCRFSCILGVPGRPEETPVSLVEDVWVISLPSLVLWSVPIILTSALALAAILVNVLR